MTDEEFERRADAIAAELERARAELDDDAVVEVMSRWMNHAIRRALELESLLERALDGDDQGAIRAVLDTLRVAHPLPGEHDAGDEL